MKQATAPIGAHVKGGGSDALPDRFIHRSKKGITREIVEEISAIKNEPVWMRELRLKAYEDFVRLPVPTWGPDLSGLHFDEITYYQRTEEGPHVGTGRRTK